MIKKNPAIRPTKKLGKSHLRKRTNAEIIDKLNNESDDFKKTPFFKRLLIKAEMLREEEKSRHESE